MTIPNLLVLKSSLDTGKEADIATAVCQRFFPLMFEKPAEENAAVLANTGIYHKFQQLKSDLAALRSDAAEGSDFFEFYNKIERQVLFDVAE